MATPAQLTANRANALRSTGPRSVEGKSVSRFNALQHGIDAQLPVIPGENSDDYNEITALYVQRFHPQTPDERYHVQTMIDADWQKRRLDRLETELYNILDSENPGMGLAAAILSGSPAAKLLLRTLQRQAAQQRAWYRASTELRRQRERDEQDALFGPQYQPEEPAEPEEFELPERTQFPDPPATQIEVFPAQTELAAPQNGGLRR